jgi:hypothetical protein
VDFEILESTTISIVVLTIVFIGGTLKYVLDWAFKKIEKDPGYIQETH